MESKNWINKDNDVVAHAVKSKVSALQWTREPNNWIKTESCGRIEFWSCLKGDSQWKKMENYVFQ